MALNWWPVAVIGWGCLLAAFALAALLPMTAARRRLRPLANTARLTRLPEYAKVARLRSLSTIVTLVVLTLMFGAASWAGARSIKADNDFDVAHPEDIMLCVGQPATDAATAELLDHFARQAMTSAKTQEIGLTSVNRRLLPLTRDHQYAAGLLSGYVGRHETQLTSFAPAVTYTDYATNVNDVLALCLSGLPVDRQYSSHRRSVIYLGPSDLRAPRESPVSLFTDNSVRELAEHTGVQVNVVDTAPSPASPALVALTEQTGGRYLAPGPGSITDALTEIRAHPPPARLPDSTVETASFQDAPAVPLLIGLLSAAVLSVTLLVLRR
ncbi:hypothetical protein [Mycobacterium genavense]|uniref:hypothetical protein n=1 Tax=Mycobacterium genavense TaxID=36812 RepID=UPI00047022C0|nr:hypothetical protein [Mycobacterium genavense]